MSCSVFQQVTQLHLLMQYRNLIFGNQTGIFDNRRVGAMTLQLYDFMIL